MGTLILTLMILKSVAIMSSAAEPQKISTAIKRSNNRLAYIHHPLPETRDLIPQRHRRQPEAANRPQRNFFGPGLLGLIGTVVIIGGLSYAIYSLTTQADESHASHGSGFAYNHSSTAGWFSNNSTPLVDVQSTAATAVNSTFGNSIFAAVIGGFMNFGAMFWYCRIARNAGDNPELVPEDAGLVEHTESASVASLPTYEYVEQHPLPAAPQVTIQVEPPRSPPPSYESWVQATARGESTVNHPPSNNALSLAVQPPSLEETHEGVISGEPLSPPTPPDSPLPTYASSNLHRNPQRE